MTMKILLAQSDRLFPNAAQFDQKLWRRLSEAGLVERKRPGRSYDALKSREIGAFLLAKLVHDDLEDAIAVTKAVADMPGQVHGIPPHWTECRAVVGGNLLDWLGALIADFTAGRANDDRGLNSCEIRLITPLPSLSVGLSVRWQHDERYRHLWPFSGLFRRSPDYGDDGDMAADLAAIERTQPKTLRMTAITTERSIDLATVRAFARAFHQ